MNEYLTSRHAAVWTDRSVIPGGRRDCLTQSTSRSALGHTQLPLQWVPAFFFGDKAAGS